MITYISNRANAFSHHWGSVSRARTAVKHIVAQGHTTICGKTLADPYTIRAGEHVLCSKCAKLAERS